MDRRREETRGIPGEPLEWDIGARKDDGWGKLDRGVENRGGVRLRTTKVSNGLGWSWYGGMVFAELPL